MWFSLLKLGRPGSYLFPKSESCNPNINFLLDSNIPFVQAVHFSPKDIHEADETCRVAHNELLQILLRKDYIIRKYKKTSQ